VIEAVAVAGLVVLSTAFLTRVMVAERSRRLLGRLVPDRGATTFRVPRKVLVAMGVVGAWLVGARVRGSSVRSRAVALTAPRWSPDGASAAGIATQNASPRRFRWCLGPALRSFAASAIELAATDLDPLLGSTFRRLGDRTGLGDPMDESIVRGPATWEV
jgi:hypothetical protein